MNMRETEACRHARGFIEAIVANPEDDAPRLIYADYLEENGQEERAEFIRVQCKLARQPDPELCSECGQHWRWRVGFEDLSECESGHRWIARDVRTWRRRDRELLSSVGRRILQTMPPSIVWTIDPLDSDYSELPKVTFRRGFVDEITLPWEDFAAHAEALLASQPITKVALSTWPPVEENSEWIWLADRSCLPYSKAGSPTRADAVRGMLDNLYLRPTFTLPQEVAP